MMSMQGGTWKFTLQGCETLQDNSLDCETSGPKQLIINVADVCSDLANNPGYECTCLTSITAASLEDQDYYVGASTVDYSFEFVTNSGCPVTYTYEINGVHDISNLVSLNTVDSVATFSFFYDTDATPGGMDFEDYEITVTGTSGDFMTGFRETTASFVLWVSNPCVDDSMVTVLPSTLIPQMGTYSLYVGQQGQAFLTLPEFNVQIDSITT